MDTRLRAHAVALCALALVDAGLAARGERPAEFGRRCTPSGCVAPSSNTPGIAPHRAQNARWGPRTLGRRTLPAGPIVALGATPDFHHGLLAGAQSYSSGQNVAPAYEGWEKNEDGSFNFLFGYMNRNWEEEIDVPIGSDNDIEPGGPDQGQPTRFLPRRNRFVFRVRVPADFGNREMVWTLTTKGKTEKAFATLRPDYFVNDVVMASETGALGAGTSSPEIRANKRPIVTIPAAAQARTVKVGAPLSLVAIVADDGVPKPRGRNLIGSGNSRPAAAAAEDRGVNRAYIPPSRVTVGKTVGLHLSWFVYRGPGKVQFDPPQVKVWEDTRTGANSPWAPLWTPPAAPPEGKWVAQATFETPGTYVVRALADDGALLAYQDVTVTVTR
jgi:hypothetical protein